MPDDATDGVAELSSRLQPSINSHAPVEENGRITSRSHPNSGVFGNAAISGIYLMFSMIRLYPVLFSINSRLQKCNLFACTPRMKCSGLSKHTTNGVVVLRRRLVLTKISGSFCRV